MKHGSFASFISSLLLIVVFTSGSLAQGWTFTFQLATDCPYNGQQAISYAQSALASALPPSLGIPDKGTCEAMRQMIMAISQPTQDCDASSPPNCVNCAVYYNCTPCTGSDITDPSQIKPGQIAFTSNYEGKPFLAKHSATSMDDWLKEYMEMLQAMYGGGNVSKPVKGIPTTGDPKFDQMYADWAITYEKPEQGGVVDLTQPSMFEGKTVPMFRTPEDIKKEEEWLSEHNMNAAAMTSISTPENAILPEVNPEEDWNDQEIRNALGALPEPYDDLAEFLLRFPDETFKAIKGPIEDFLAGNDEAAAAAGERLMSGQVVLNVGAAAVTEGLQEHANEVIDNAMEAAGGAMAEIVHTNYQQSAVSQLVQTGADIKPGNMQELRRINNTVQQGRAYYQQLYQDVSEFLEDDD